MSLDENKEKEIINNSNITNEEKNMEEDIELTDKQQEQQAEDIKELEKAAENTNEVTQTKPEENIDEKKQDIANKKENENTEYKPVENKKTKKQVKTVIAVLIIVAIVLIISLVSTIFALVNLTNNKVIDGITIKGVELVGFSKEDAKLDMEELSKQQLSMQIILQYEDYETSISPEQIEASYNIDKAIEIAYSIGREGNIIIYYHFESSELYNII